MKERPIIFGAPMIRAILDGAKTQTRRLVPLARDVEFDGYTPDFDVLASKQTESTGTRRIRNRYGLPGQRLWLKEAWRPSIAHGHGADACDCADVNVDYAADGSRAFFAEGDVPNNWKMPKAASSGWVTPLYMPKWASRIALEVTSVRVERLHEITDVDAQAEGVVPFFERFPSIGRDQCITSGEPAAESRYRASYAVLWDEINGDKATWKSNPYVWVIGFKRDDTLGANSKGKQQ